MRCLRLTAALFLAVLAVPGNADEIQPRAHPTTGAEIVIVPVTVGTSPGLSGAVWSVEGVAHNSSALYTARLFVGTCRVDRIDECTLEIPPRKSVPLPLPLNDPIPYNSILVPNAFDDHEPGTTPNDIWFQLRVRDLTRQAESAGTEIPIVRTRNLLDRTAQLLDIPIDSRFRTHLRLYLHPNGNPDGRFVLRLFRTEEGGNETLVEERRVTVPLPVLLLIYTGYPVGQLLVPDLFRGVDCGSCRVRVEIDPEGEGVRYWAFVSVTNNETHEITTISPQ